MPKRTAQAVWEGTIEKGEGRMSVGSGAFEGRFSFGSRFSDQQGTNPEELIGAAHAGCFSMALALLLEKAGFRPQSIQTRAEVKIEKNAEGFAITSITLNTSADVPGMEENAFLEQAETAKKNCPVSKALAGTEIILNADIK